MYFVPRQDRNCFESLPGFFGAPISWAWIILARDRQWSGRYLIRRNNSYHAFSKEMPLNLRFELFQHFSLRPRLFKYLSLFASKLKGFFLPEIGDRKKTLTWLAGSSSAEVTTESPLSSRFLRHWQKSWYYGLNSSIGKFGQQLSLWG